MKKVLLLMAVATIGFCSAANGKLKTSLSKEIVQLCTVAVTYYNSSGQVIEYGAFSSDQPTIVDCKSYAESVVKDLEAKGSIVTRPLKQETGLE